MTPPSIPVEDFRSAVPEVTRDFQLKGLDASINIYRDAYGIPHVSAQTVHDAFFGQGFVAAQDRLWHMDFDRHHAYGRLAEWFGESAVDKDVTLRRFQIGVTVKGDYQAVNADTRAMLDAYSDGVNAFIEGSDRLPVEYRLLESEPEPWRAWDCFAVYKIRHIMMGVFEGKLWRARLVNAIGPEKAAKLLYGYPAGHLVIVPPGADYRGAELDGLDALQENLSAIEWLKEHPDSGSNSWLVHGRRTASGKPLLAGDSHRLLDTPNAYYQNHVACPEFDVIGASFPGCPGFPHFGHNADVAWCVTHAQADYQDLYVERFSPDDASTYEFQGEWKPTEIRHEVIEVRHAASRTIDVFVTHHGPVITGDPAKGYGIAFKYTATADPYVGFDCLLPMMKAATVDAMDAAMEKWIDPCNNFLSTDRNGDIAYLHRGRIPIRPMANAWLPVPGWTGEYEWRGDIPFAEMSRIRNPENGFIVTANNRIPDENYPYYIALNYVPEFRARRIWNRLSEMPSATVESMQAVHAERISMPARVLSELIARLEPADDFFAKAQAEIVDWNCAMDRDEVAPTIYSAFRITLLKRFVEHLVGPLCEEMFTATGRGAPRHLGELAVRMAAMVKSDDTGMLPPGETWLSMAKDAFSEAISFLGAQFGDDMETWRWGTVHRTCPKHPLSDLFPELKGNLDPPSVGMGGDGDTPLAAGFAPAKPFVVTLLSVLRYVYDTADWDNSGWAVPLGVSGHPGSPHYADQSDAWSRVGLVPMLYSWDRIKEEAATHQVLSPE